MTTIDELLANIGPEDNRTDVFEDEKTYDEALKSFKDPKTIYIDFSMVESDGQSRVTQIWDLIRAEFENAKLDWKLKDVAVNIEDSPSFGLQFGEMSDILGLIQNQVHELYWTLELAQNNLITITYSDL